MKFIDYLENLINEAITTNEKAIEDFILPTLKNKGTFWVPLRRKYTASLLPKRLLAFHQLGYQHLDKFLNINKNVSISTFTNTNSIKNLLYQRIGRGSGLLAVVEGRPISISPKDNKSRKEENRRWLNFDKNISLSGYENIKKDVVRKINNYLINNIEDDIKKKINNYLINNIEDDIKKKINNYLINNIEDDIKKKINNYLINNIEDSEKEKIKNLEIDINNIEVLNSLNVKNYNYVMNEILNSLNVKNYNYVMNEILNSLNVKNYNYVMNEILNSFGVKEKNAFIAFYHKAVWSVIKEKNPKNPDFYKHLSFVDNPIRKILLSKPLYFQGNRSNDMSYNETIMDRIKIIKIYYTEDAEKYIDKNNPIFIPFSNEKFEEDLKNISNQ